MVEMLRELRQAPCADCGRRFRPYQMEFDHRDPSTKSFNVMAGRAMLMSTKRVLEEVAKCDIVCVNCHRVRTRDAERRRPRKPLSSYPSAQAKALRWKEQSALLHRLRDVPCSDCGERFPACAMDFDHRETETKEYVVTRMVARATTEQILAEASKCDIVCGNCHRARTYRRSTSGRE